MISYFYPLARYYFYRLCCLEIRPDNKVLLTFNNNTSEQVNLVKVLVSNRLFLVLIWRHRKKRYQQVIWRDMCHQQEYHHLLLWANWCQKDRL